MKVDVLKYYSIGTYHNVLSAAKRVEEARKRHPDREFTVLTNMRGGATKFVAAQVQNLRVELPTEEDLGLPPMPKQPPWNDDQAWEDWRYERDRRDRLLKAAQASGAAAIKAKLNP
jgi:hypothetical protein